MNFDPNCMAIAIGSLPHTDVEAALDIVQKYLPEAPIWPQLPKTGFNESMTVQYTEGMPCVRIDRENNKAYFDTSGADFIDRVSERLESALAGRHEEFRISREYAKGFYALMERFAKEGLPPAVKAVKGHVTGPISFGLSMHDESGRSALYNETIKDALVNILAMKGKWQAEEIKRLGGGAIPIIFFDEPYLTQIGTPFIAIQREEAIDMLNTCIDQVDGITGIHICGNTDWSLVTDTNTDIINFDAYAYPESLSLYPDEIRSFLDGGGMIAWGITPSTKEIENEDKHTILAKLEHAVDLLCKDVFDKKFVLRRSLVSPSCGTGTLSEELSEKVFRVNREVSDLIRERHLLDIL